MFYTFSPKQLRESTHVILFLYLPHCQTIDVFYQCLYCDDLLQYEVHHRIERDLYYIRANLIIEILVCYLFFPYRIAEQFFEYLFFPDWCLEYYFPYLYSCYF